MENQEYKYREYILERESIISDISSMEIAFGSITDEAFYRRLSEIGKKEEDYNDHP